MAEIQGVMERTYSPAGVNLEECLITWARSRELAARAGVGATGGPGCTFLREQGGDLYIGIFYAPEIIEVLEREDPRESLSHRNVRALIVFLEEITHGVHAALAFRRGWKHWDSEAFACGLEAQARVDVYYLLLRFVKLVAGEVTEASREWVRRAVFEGERAPGGGQRLARRYALARRLAWRFVRCADGMEPGERRQAIREFHRATLAGKARWGKGSGRRAGTDRARD